MVLAKTCKPALQEFAAGDDHHFFICNHLTITRTFKAVCAQAAHRLLYVSFSTSFPFDCNFFEFFIQLFSASFQIINQNFWIFSWNKHLHTLLVAQKPSSLNYFSQPYQILRISAAEIRPYFRFYIYIYDSIKNIGYVRLGDYQQSPDKLTMAIFSFRFKSLEITNWDSPTSGISTSGLRLSITMTRMLRAHRPIRDLYVRHAAFVT